MIKSIVSVVTVHIILRLKQLFNINTSILAMLSCAQILSFKMYVRECYNTKLCKEAMTVDLGALFSSND